MIKKIHKLKIKYGIVETLNFYELEVKHNIVVMMLFVN